MEKNKNLYLRISTSVAGHSFYGGKLVLLLFNVSKRIFTATEHKKDIQKKNGAFGICVCLFV